MKKTILIAEDDVNVADGLGQYLKKKDYEVIVTYDGESAREIAKKEDINLLLTDLLLSKLYGLDLIREVKKEKPDIQFIMMTAFGDIELAVQAMKEGAYDFLTKPLEMRKLGIVIEKALEVQVLSLRNKQLQQTLEDHYTFSNVIGRSSMMKKVFEVVRQVSPRRSNVLICGESGTGKELIANAIHYNSPRTSMPFIKVNCGALSEGVLESELFGHEKGAFTGAISRRRGRFELAHGGTIFLDEVSEMSPATQVKLLRVLQEGEFERVGGDKTLKVDIRIIAATNKDLWTAVKHGKFRDDLFYRLNVVKIELPLLRERKEDIPFLVTHFIEKFNKRHDLSIQGINHKALDLLLAYDWLGNVRELENCIESSMLSTTGLYILPANLPAYVKVPALNDKSIVIQVGMAMPEIERLIYKKTLEETKGNKTKAAKLLGVGVRTVHRKALEYGL